MLKEIKTREWIENFGNGLYDSNDRHTQIVAGWYDWFCKETSLRNKTQKMGKIIARIKDGGKVDLDKTYVWFKNNCPLNGPLYDDFRFGDLENGNTLFTIQLDCCWNEKKYTVYGRHNDFEKPLFETDKVKELIMWFNSPWAS